MTNKVPGLPTRPEPTPPELADKFDVMDCRPGGTESPVQVSANVQRMLDAAAAAKAKSATAPCDQGETIEPANPPAE